MEDFINFSSRLPTLIINWELPLKFNLSFID